MTTSANFLGDVPDLDHMPDRLRLGDERAAARAAYDDSRRLQFAKRPICGHARDVKFLDQLCFRRDAITRLQTPVANRIRYALLDRGRSEEHTSELQSLMRNSYAVFCLKK